MFILASNSPRRKELLSSIIKDFKVVVKEIDESKFPYEQLSYFKAIEVADAYPDDIIISGDTVVILDNKILGKPKDKEDAYNTLKALSNRVHEVKTSYTIYSKNKHINVTRIVTSKVTFNDLSDEEIASYIAYGSCYDKAGSYGIQDNDKFHLIKEIEGSYNNIVGFPIEEIYLNLKKLDLIK